MHILQRFKGGLLGASHSWVVGGSSAQTVELFQPDAPHPGFDHRHNGTPSSITKATVWTASELQQKILHLVGLYIPTVRMTEPLFEQGLDSLASMELRQKLNESLGVELTSLTDDPQGATISSIVEEAVALLAQTVNEPSANANGMPQQALLHQEQSRVHNSVSVLGNQSLLDSNSGHTMPWISPAPVTVKMRLFCIPYAGGVSENVFGR